MDAGGCFLEPTILVIVKPSMRGISFGFIYVLVENCG